MVPRDRTWLDASGQRAEFSGPNQPRRASNGAAKASNAAALINSSAPALQVEPFLPRKCLPQAARDNGAPKSPRQRLIGRGKRCRRHFYVRRKGSFFWRWESGLCKVETDGRQLKAQSAKLYLLSLITWHRKFQIHDRYATGSEQSEFNGSLLVTNLSSIPHQVFTSDSGD